MSVPGARDYRPALHYTPERGWINDPNGLLYDGAKYHLFAQHYPDDTKWGPMHWSHAVSADALHWEHLPIALKPDQLGMCFSGSAAMIDGKIALMYTSHGEHEQQSVALSSDGVHFAPYSGNPVIPNGELTDFRDPKVFWDADRNRYAVAVAAGHCVEFYASADMLHWRKTGEFSDQAHLTGIHECPDVFPMRLPDGSTTWVMIASMILPDSQGNRTQYALGAFDGSAFRLTRPFDEPEWIDIGYNNYAPVTFYGAKEPTLLGWASCWAYADRLPTGAYCGQMTLPRSLSMVDTKIGPRLAQRPISALDALTGPCRPAVNGMRLPGELFRLRTRGRAPYTLELTNGKEHIRISLTPEKLLLDARQAGECGHAQELHEERYGILQGNRITADDQLDLVFDRSILEVFADCGTRTATCPVFPASPYTSLQIEGDVQVELSEIRV